MLNKYFVNQGVKLTSIENYIRAKFPSGDYSSIDLQTTPLGIKIVIYTNKPGKIIGRGGRNIDEITDTLKREFNLENPQIDVKEIANADLDAKIVAKQIKSALEKGFNYKKIGNLTMRRIMEAGALGAQIVIAGKMGGSKSATAKFIEGHIKHSGEQAKQLVDEGFEVAITRPGTIGIHVRIMVEGRDIAGNVVRKGVAPAALAPRPERIEEELEKTIEADLEAEKPKKAKKKAAAPKAKAPRTAKKAKAGAKEAEAKEKPATGEKD